MTDRYSRMVRDFIVEADQRAAASSGVRVNRGVALAGLLEGEGFAYQPTAVRAWMRGDTKPPVDVFLAISARTGMSVDERLQLRREESDVERQLEEVHGQLADLRAEVDRLGVLAEWVRQLSGDETARRPTGADRVDDLTDRVAQIAAELSVRRPEGRSRRRARKEESQPGP
jgi:hypothetical protein